MTGRPYVETLVFLGGISADVRAWVREHPDGDAPVAWALEGSLGLGGRAATAAVGAVRLGRRFVDLVGCVGDDLLGNSLVSSLKDAGVSIRLVDRLDGAPTAIRQVVVDSKGERRSVGVANANAQVGQTQTRRADSTIFGADLLFATLEVPVPTVEQVVTMAAGRKVPVLLNATPVPAATGEQDLSRPLLANVDVLLTDWTAGQRMADMTGVTGPSGVELSKRLLRLGPKSVVVTLGEHGSIVAVPGKHALIEPYTVRAVDDTAAGDAYASALAVGLTSQSRGRYRWEHLVEAARLASAAAALAVSKAGSHESLPTREDVERLMASQPIPRPK